SAVASTSESSSVTDGATGSAAAARAAAAGAAGRIASVSVGVVMHARAEKPRNVRRLTAARQRAAGRLRNGAPVGWPAPAPKVVSSGSDRSEREAADARGSTGQDS